MPELPEIASRAAEINQDLSGKTISAIEILQPKCLNISPEEFVRSLTGATLQSARNRGKWIQVETTQGWLMLNLGMGGELLLVTRQTLPERYRLIVDFSDGTCLAVNFWWFGSAHYVASDALSTHEPTAKLGPNVLDLSASDLAAILKGQRTRLKALLLDQSKIAGIGNAYIHDILFMAKLHPLRPVNSLMEEEIEGLAAAIQKGLRPALEKGGAFYELNLHGQKGGFMMEDVIIGYREGQPCPVCGTPIEKIKTGGTSSFICPQCQR